MWSWCRPTCLQSANSTPPLRLCCFAFGYGNCKSSPGFGWGFLVPGGIFPAPESERDDCSPPQSQKPRLVALTTYFRSGQTAWRLRKRTSVSEDAVQSGKQIFVGTPKAHKQRSVPLPAFLLPYLARQCEGKDRDGLLWLGDDGNHLRRRTRCRDGSPKRSQPRGYRA